MPCSQSGCVSFSVCQQGSFQCALHPCAATCTAYGDRHYRTFDGLPFDFVGACKVHLVKVSSGCVCLAGSTGPRAAGAAALSGQGDALHSSLMLVGGWGSRPWGVAIQRPRERLRSKLEAGQSSLVIKHCSLSTHCCNLSRWAPAFSCL